MTIDEFEIWNIASAMYFTKIVLKINTKKSLKEFYYPKNAAKKEWIKSYRVWQNHLSILEEEEINRFTMKEDL